MVTGYIMAQGRTSYYVRVTHRHLYLRLDLGGPRMFVHPVAPSTRGLIPIRDRSGYCTSSLCYGTSYSSR